MRLRKKQIAEYEQQNAGALKATKASLRNVPTSPRKMRLVADLIRGKSVMQALNILKFNPKHASRIVEKLLKTAIADWELKNPDFNIEEEELVISKIYVDGGRMLKRLRPAPQGRGYRIRKRSNHLTIVLDRANISQN
ncbi:MAG: 50S ribosomal protein L22 [Cytophagales bacterium]|nr:50S ribosomal protein L22 [Cytophagales bacterium]